MKPTLLGLLMALAVLPFSLAWAGFAEDAARQAKESSAYECLSGYPCFKLSDQYPQELPAAEDYPWLAFDFTSEPEAYMGAVLGYVLEGNVAVDWDIAKNQTRLWFHAPWMHWGPRGREPVHGLTRERSSKWHELSPQQVRRVENWAVGFYNARGGYTVGQVWKDPARPDSPKGQFPVGTVSAKLLFTEATDEEAPYLKSEHGLVWEAQIKRNQAPRQVRLLQLDVAVRDARADAYVGWVFGTFIFDGTRGGATYAENLVPVGLEWGNDPDLTYADYKAGQRPKQGWVNPKVLAMFRLRPPEADMGYLGRVNGPVDSPFSSCLACHSRAVDTKGGSGPAFTPELSDLCMRELPRGDNKTFERIPDCQVQEQQVRVFFRNLKPNEPFIAGDLSLDYSLQLASGIANWYDWFEKTYPERYAKQSPRLKSLAEQILTFRVETLVTIPMLPRHKAFSRGGDDL